MKIFGKSKVGFGEISKKRPTATSNAFVRCATTPNADGGALVEITPMDGYELEHVGEHAQGATFAVRKLADTPPVAPKIGRSYMIGGKEVTVGRIDYDNDFKPVAVYDADTNEKHLWPSAK